MLKYQIQTDTFASIENSLIFMYKAFQRLHWYCVILAVNKQKKRARYISQWSGREYNEYYKRRSKLMMKNGGQRLLRTKATVFRNH